VIYWKTSFLHNHLQDSMRLMFNGFKKLLIKGCFNSSALNKVNIIKRKKRGEVLKV